MATFKGTTQPAYAASQLLHPAAAGLRPRTIEPSVLADIAMGLAASVDPNWRIESGSPLLHTESYRAVVELVEGEGSLTVSGSLHDPVAMAVVSGELLVWTVNDGVHALGAGGSCAAPARERFQAVNFDAHPAIVVIVRAIESDASADATHGRSSWRSLVY